MMLQEVSGEAILFLRKNPHYPFVFFVFIAAIFYYIFIIPPEALKKEKMPKNKVQTELPSLNAKHQEKIYNDIFQSQAGDVFRLGAFIKTKNAEVIEILAESGLNEILKLEEWNLQPSEKGEYRELFFQTPGRYEDIVIRLKRSEKTKKTDFEKNWDDSAVSISAFSISRVEAQNLAGTYNLASTVFGISTMTQDILLSQKKIKKDTSNEDKPSDSVEWLFSSKGDFLEALEFSGDVVGKGRQEYVFKLMRYFPDSKEAGELLHSTSFVLDAIDDLMISTGNYRMPFNFPLKKGEWYKIALVKTPSKDRDNYFSIGTLEMESGAVGDDTRTGDLALLLRERLRTKNDASFLDGAKLEDLGKNLVYSFSLQGAPVDFLNIYEASSGISYDERRRLVTGSQKNRQYFVYKFDMPYFFDRFVLEAVQEGNDEREIKLEYSLDNAFWREISFTQETGEPQKFILTLERSEKSRIVYVRASYNGAEKKSGFFALKALDVKASLEKK